MKRSLLWVPAALLVLLMFACAGQPPAAPEAESKEAEAPEVAEESPAAEGETPEDSEAKSLAFDEEAPAEAAKTRDSAAGSVLGELGDLEYVADIGESMEVAEAFEGLGGPGGAEPMAAAPRSAAPRPAPTSSGLKAGFADDNRQFNYYLGFLSEFGPRVEHLSLDVSERILLRVEDSAGRPLPNAALEISAEGRLLCRGTSYSDGGFFFFPSLYGEETSYRVQAAVDQDTRTLQVERNGPREQTLTFPAHRAAADSVPLDLCFILDTTGSMGEEIERLKATIEIINLNLSSLAVRPRVRYGMVLYKDRGDEYVTRVVPLTSDLEAFQAELAGVEADGGGDTPEDLQAALQAAMALDWNRRGVRLSFVITDAPPHLDYGQKYTYLRAAEDARARGIRLYTVGTGGLELMGEFVLRQLSQQTGARYIFLTYGESGESEGGRPGSVSHHTGANFQTDKLEAIIIRFAKEELAYLTDQPLEEGEEYFEARKLEEERKEETLSTLFSMAVSQLIDYSSFRIPAATPASVLPISPAQDGLSLTAEYFSEQLILTCGADETIRSTFRMVERADLQKLLEEMELQLSGLAGDAEAARVGRLLGADLLIAGTLYEKQKGYELFLRLLRVETGEILSVTKALLDRGLGLETD